MTLTSAGRRPSPTRPRTIRQPDMQGERFAATTRLVVAPVGGIFEPAMDLRPGRTISDGQVVGHLTCGADRTPIISQFSGKTGEALAWAGERLTLRQPVMWLSTQAGAQ